MQNLTNTQPLVNLFVPRDKNQELEIVMKLPKWGSVTRSLCGFMNNMYRAPKPIISPATLFMEICKKAPRFKGFRQQDSHELLRCLMDIMIHEEITRVKTEEKPQLNAPPINRNQMKTFVDEVFGGVLTSTVTCHECKTVSRIFENFLDLSLQIPVKLPEETKNSKRKNNATPEARQQNTKK